MTCSFLCVVVDRALPADTTTPGEPVAGSIELNEVTKKSRCLATDIGSRRMSWVIVQNRSTNADGTANATNLVFGDATNQVIELSPGASSMPLPFRELAELFARSL